MYKHIRSDNIKNIDIRLFRIMWEKNLCGEQDEEGEAEIVQPWDT